MKKKRQCLEVVTSDLAGTEGLAHENEGRQMYRYRGRMAFGLDVSLDGVTGGGHRWSKGRHAFSYRPVDCGFRSFRCRWIVSLYSADALFLGTGSKQVVTGSDAIRSYFEEALLTRRPRAAPISSQEVRVLYDNVVLVTGLNDSTGVIDGMPFSNPGRVTFVLAKRGSEWLIVHFHRSAMPKQRLC